MFQPNEVLNLGLAIVLTPLFFDAAIRSELPGKGWLFAAYGAMLAAYVATVAEGVWFASALNLAEHLSLAAAGALFVRFALGLRVEDAVRR